MRRTVKRIFSLYGKISLRLHGWLHPAGLFIVVLGPDGAGKSTLIQRLVEDTRPAFCGHQQFHWRPASLWRRKYRGDVTDPHGQPAYSMLWSVARIFAHLMDYWFSYFTTIRPALAHSRLVVFDRYFYDLSVDPRRYRYGGPQWIISTLISFVPKPHLTLVLDASEQAVLSRKREIEPNEIRRQRHLYRLLARRISGTLIPADQGVEQVLGKASEAVAGLLSARCHPI